MNIEVGYGAGTQSVQIAERNLMGILAANSVPVDFTGAEEVQRALREPIDSPRLRDIVQPGEAVAIITSDITRPMPTSEVLPYVLEELQAAGVVDEAITLVFGLGSHRQHTLEEQRRLAGEEVYSRIRCIDSSADELVSMGVTAAGTPVDVCATVARADRRICLGNIEYHYFAGYSGGMKAIMPGVSTAAAIANNHSLMTDPRACAGNLDSNPVRVDIE